MHVKCYMEYPVHAGWKFGRHPYYQTYVLTRSTFDGIIILVLCYGLHSQSLFPMLKVSMVLTTISIFPVFVSAFRLTFQLLLPPFPLAQFNTLLRNPDIQAPKILGSGGSRNSSRECIYCVRLLFWATPS